MPEYRLTITLRSDATFARGEGIAADVDTEIDCDGDGLPQIGARRLKGLLAQEGRNLLAVSDFLYKRFAAVHEELFGAPGSGLAGQGLLQFAPARLPAWLRQPLVGKFSTDKIWNALTDTRRQTALDEESGAPDAGSLRSQRVLLRKLQLEAPITAPRELSQDEQRWLAVCCLALRRGGLRRNRGRGRLTAIIDFGQGEPSLREQWESLQKEVADHANAAAHH